MTQDADETLRAYPGRHVELEVTYEGGDVERLSLDLVLDAQADFERGFLGESTPLAQAIFGRAAGETVHYQAGERARVKILEVRDGWAGEPEDLSKRREEAERRAVDKSDTTSVMLFASSFSGKWGDYDPKAVKGAEEEDEEEE